MKFDTSDLVRDYHHGYTVSNGHKLRNTSATVIQLQNIILGVKERMSFDGDD